MILKDARSPKGRDEGPHGAGISFVDDTSRQVLSIPVAMLGDAIPLISDEPLASRKHPRTGPVGSSWRILKERLFVKRAA